jgi:hypothetical protein
VAFDARRDDAFGAAGRRLEASPEIEQAMRRLDLWPTDDAVQAAFRRKAMTDHSDRGGTDPAMIEVYAARDRFLDLVS